MSWPLIQPFVQLSYPAERPAEPDSFPDAAYYSTGPKDVLLIISCIAVMAVLRDITRIYLCEPFARWKLIRDYALKATVKANGQPNGQYKLSKKELQKIHHGIVRFAEQGWALVYYALQWCHGYHINIQLPNGLIDHVNLWAGYPHIPIPGPVKFYYLTQTAFYIHQMLILNAEARRKDHYQMMAHHVITVFLMGTSYYFNFTRVGCLIMVLMDWCDIFLPLAKMMKYIGLPHQIYDYVFGCFLLSWLVTRHILFLPIIYSTIFDTPTIIQLEWDPENGRFLSTEYHAALCVCLSALQIIQLFWFITICRVAYNVLMKGEEAADVRSDEEGEGDEIDLTKDD